jgi:hypothetical protein
MVNVIFACPACSVAYVATQERCRDERAGRFECRACAALVYEWVGSYEYAAWRVFETEPQGVRPPSRRDRPANRTKKRSKK